MKNYQVTIAVAVAVAVVILNCLDK